MNRMNVAVIAGLLALAAVLGTVAATHTVSLGSAQKQNGERDRADAARSSSTAYEASLRRALAKKPPALPAVPKTPAAPSVPAAQQRVVYRRPPAIVVVKHTHHGDDGCESAQAATAEAAAMASHTGRLYSLALALVVFFLAWAVVAAHPWGATAADPRLQALAVREAQLRHEAQLVNQVVALRWAAYRSALKARTAQIAAAKAQATQQLASVSSGSPSGRCASSRCRR